MSRHSKQFYIRADKHESLYKTVFGITDWKDVEIQLYLFEGEKFNYRCILTNDRKFSEAEVMSRKYERNTFE
ncbi:MAG: hypothetical protein LBC19_12200 [Tannerella sp.]|nr:hypothetical protein [Tannerella sp.]